MRYAHLSGQPCLLMARCSTDLQVDESLPDQEFLLRGFAEEHKMPVVGMVRLEGVTGSLPGARTEIPQIIKRKKTTNDFNVLLVYDVSRFSRAGGNHIGWLTTELAKAGIKVVFVKDDLPQGRHSQLVQQLVAYSSNEYAFKLSETTARGEMERMKKGVIAHCARPPFAVDRLYVAPDGTPRYVIRSMPGGRQVRLDYPSMAVKEEFGIGKKNHYKKRGDESVVLVPGEERLVEAVRQMFTWTLVDGRGYMWISQELNALKVPTQRGNKWDKNVVRQILQNPVYTGRGVANKVTRAIYNVRSVAGPMPVDKELHGTAFYEKDSLPQRKRDRTDWFEQHHPKLVEFLPPHLKALAEDWHRLLSEERPRPKVVNDAHPESPYILKGLLTAVQGGHRMTGRQCGSGKYAKRYYGVNKGRNAPERGSVLKRVIPAEEVERAVLAEVRETLLNMDGIEERVRRAVEQEVQAAQLAPDIGQLQTERKKLAAKVKFIHDSYDVLGDEEARKRLCEVADRQKELELTLREAGAAERPTAEEVAENAQALLKRLRRLGEHFLDLPQAALRRLLEILVRRAEVDLETREIAVEIGIPMGLLSKKSGLGAAMGLGEVSARPSLPEAQTDSAVILGVFECRTVGRPMCITCSRYKFAA